MKHLGEVIYQFGVSYHRYVDDRCSGYSYTVFGGSKDLDGMKQIEF